jgi:DnaJ-class molecular chaperone
MQFIFATIFGLSCLVANARFESYSTNRNDEATVTYKRCGICSGRGYTRCRRRTHFCSTCRGKGKVPVSK